MFRDFLVDVILGIWFGNTCRGAYNLVSGVEVNNLIIVVSRLSEIRRIIDSFKFWEEEAIFSNEMGEKHLVVKSY